MSKPKNENAMEKRYMDLVLSILQSSYWRDQGKGYFGTKKTPKSIVEMRDKFLTDPSFTMQKLQPLVDAIKNKKSRSQNTTALYDILKSHETLDSKIDKLENLKKTIESILDRVNENHGTKPSFK